MNKGDDKMLYYNLKLNEEYFYCEMGNEWVLTRNKFLQYKVMNSKSNTKEELKQFIKEHKTYKYEMVIGLISIIYSFITVILSFINIKLKSVELRYFIYGSLFYLFIELLFRNIIIAHNNKIKNKIYEEDKKFLESKKQ